MKITRCDKMAKYMSEDDYLEYTRLTKEFTEVLISCAQEISVINRGRELIGEFNEEIDWYDEGKYFVQFEKESCGDIDYDSEYVPIEYIYSELYREHHKRYLISEKERKVQEALEREEYKKAHTYRIITDERAEYERLKLKFDDSKL